MRSLSMPLLTGPMRGRQWSSAEVVGRYDLKLWITTRPEARRTFLAEIQDDEPGV